MESEGNGQWENMKFLIYDTSIFSDVNLMSKLTNKLKNMRSKTKKLTKYLGILLGYNGR